MKKCLSICLAALLLGIFAASLFVNDPTRNKDTQCVKKEEREKREDIEEEKTEKIKVALKKLEERKRERPSPKKRAALKKKARPREKRLKKNVNVNMSLIEKGLEMVGDRGENIGGFPSLTASYRNTIGFSRYVSLISELGGRFYVQDRIKGALTAEIDFERRELWDISISELGHLSPRSRTIEGEKDIKHYLRMADERYGPSDYAVVLLFPLSVDALIIAGIDDSLKSICLRVRDFSSFRALYKENKGDLILIITSGRLKKGNVKTMRLTFNLARL